MRLAINVLCKLAAPFQVLLLIDELDFRFPEASEISAPVEFWPSGRRTGISASVDFLRSPPWAVSWRLLASFDERFLLGLVVEGGENDGKEVKTFGEAGISLAPLLRPLLLELEEACEPVRLERRGTSRSSIGVIDSVSTLVKTRVMRMLSRLSIFHLL